MKIDGFIPADPKIAYEEGTTFTYSTPYGEIVVIAKMAGNDNQEFNQGYQKISERHAREKMLGTVDTEKQFRDFAQLYADAVVIRWSTTVKSGGKPIDPTKENFVDLVTSEGMIGVWRLFTADVADLANFRAAREEETAKNS